MVVTARQHSVWSSAPDCRGAALLRVTPRLRASPSHRDMDGSPRSVVLAVAFLCGQPCRWHSVMGEQPVSSQSADAGVGQQAARRSAMSRCSRQQFRRLFGAYDRAKGHHMAIVPARGWRGSCDVPVGWTEEHQCTWNPASGAPRAELLRCHGVLTSALKRGLTAGTTGHSAGPARAQRRGP